MGKEGAKNGAGSICDKIDRARKPVVKKQQLSKFHTAGNKQAKGTDAPPLLFCERK